MAIDETLPAETLLAGEAERTDALPEKWDRYELADKLGEGGMGIVYKARDRRLGRVVAIKFIRGGNPMLTMRLIREARAQARIDHPGVCGVYEVGEVAGRAYIALQFVAGEPLGRAAAGMSLDEKIAVMRDVAVAIHEAHRLGIVHRDLKPANVMVERGEDGRWLAVVMDFGLAREATLEVGLTESGTLLGTPAYMSPEQARGDLRAIDRRSDVYSLGATLYELLTERLPFSSESLAVALDLVINHDPIPPRKLVPTLPVDLETITLKCLHKDPAERYASARAFADDLVRYLDGDPILGRRPTLSQRLRTSMRRHRALYVLGASSAVAVLTAGGLGLRSYVVSRSERAHSIERTQLAQELGREAKDIELLLHTTYQLPLHDTRPERLLIRTRMMAIAATPHELGPLGDAVIHDALGRGHLALHEWAAAISELERAAQAGLDTPELHAARGRALGELYHRAIEEARRSGDKTWLAAREKELEQQYLLPALAELERARGAADSGALLDVLIALYRRDYSTAKTRALEIARTTPWVYESKKLAADAVYAAAVVDVDRGNYDAARPQLEQASALYAQEAEIARSDATVYEAAAQARLERAEIDLRQNHPTKQALDDAGVMIDRSIAAAPDDATAYTTKAYILLLRSRAKVDAAATQRTVLDQSGAAAEQAVKLDPTNAGAWDALGNVHITSGIYDDYYGGKGEPWWRRSLDEFAHALAIRPNDPWTNNDLGTAHRWIGVTLAKSGGDPMPEFRAALDGYERATTIDPGYVFAWANRANLAATLANYLLDHDGDPTSATEEAVRTGERGLAVDPSFDRFLIAMADAVLARAEHLIAINADPTPMLAAARDDLARADKLRPNNLTTWLYRSRAARLEARWLLSQHGDAHAALLTAHVASEKAMELAPTSSASWIERAENELVAGELPAARADADKASVLDDHDPTGKIVAASVQLALAQRTPDRAAIDLGLKLVEQALAIDPRSERAKRVRASLAALVR
jgi:eukaryotic-like serine/threonine-protein kinase